MLAPVAAVSCQAPICVAPTPLASVERHREYRNAPRCPVALVTAWNRKLKVQLAEAKLPFSNAVLKESPLAPSGPAVGAVVDQSGEVRLTSTPRSSFAYE